ncbi:MAG: 2-aminoethylphosphonate--pyruvate transaminase [Phycisphaerales bacterium JB063]
MVPQPLEPHDVGFPCASDPKLFTPGPLTTSLSVKQAMAHDIGAWDAPLIAMVKEIRDGLLEAAGVTRAGGWDVTLQPGSGTFGVESMLGSLTPPGGKLLLIANGAYGERLIRIAQMLKIAVVALRFAEDEPACPVVVAKALAEHSDVTGVGVIHCETTTGMNNDIAAVGRVVKEAGKLFLVDAMSSFGAVPIDFDAVGVDALVSSANKCMEGVPGFSFVFAKVGLLESARDGRWARSHSLDLAEQWQGQQTHGRFRFTPPNQVLLAFRQAMREFVAEGGVTARQARYQGNYETLVDGMSAMGFGTFLDREKQSYIITTFLCPADPRFDFMAFYRRLSERGFVIYPGKVTGSDCFRIGSIGRLYKRDMRGLLLAIGEVVAEMGFDPAPPARQREEPAIPER